MTAKLLENDLISPFRYKEKGNKTAKQPDPILATGEGDSCGGDMVNNWYNNSKQW